MEQCMKNTTKYSAHAKADEMIEFLNQFKNLKLVLVNHGESRTKNIFCRANCRRSLILKDRNKIVL